jgi:UDP-N-acetylglucosamine--N-acetylmuramyl-(pentapeptide) pyrophosphoryl-undecaprenol N-acetylglucosamine transferase
MDERLVKPTGLRFEAVRAAPLRVGSPLSAIRNAAALAIGTVQAWLAIGRFRPNVVFATGGYASVPVGLASRARRRPLVVYLPDVTPGWAVRLLSKLATRMATTTDQSLRQLPAGKAQAVGYPVRPEFWTSTRQTSREQLGLPQDANVLLVSGASQGARSLNDAVTQQLHRLLEVCHVVHLTGSDDEQRMQVVRSMLPASAQDRYHVFGFLEDMAGAMAAADLAVMRSGASVLGELPASGLAAILVPGVYAAGHNQRDNARYLQERGGAIALENDQLNLLNKLVEELVLDDARRGGMAEAMRKLARPDAAKSIAHMLEEVAA